MRDEIAKLLEGYRMLLGDALLAFARAIEAGGTKKQAAVDDVDYSEAEEVLLCTGVVWPSGCSGGIRVPSATYYSRSFREPALVEAILEGCEYEPEKLLLVLERLRGAEAWCREQADARDAKARRLRVEKNQLRDHAAWAFDNQPEAVRELKALLVARELKEGEGR